MSKFDELHEHLQKCVDSNNPNHIAEVDGVEFNVFEWAFGLSVQAKKEHDGLVELVSKLESALDRAINAGAAHADRADEFYAENVRLRETLRKLARASTEVVDISGAGDDVFFEYECALDKSVALLTELEKGDE